MAAAEASRTGALPKINARERVLLYLATVFALAQEVLRGVRDIDEAIVELSEGYRVDQTEAVRMKQMGAKRIGSLAIGIGVVGIVLNEMSSLSIVNNSTGVIDVSSIFETAGSGLNLLVVGVIIAAAAVLLSLWSGF